MLSDQGFQINITFTVTLVCSQHQRSKLQENSSLELSARKASFIKFMNELSTACRCESALCERLRASACACSIAIFHIHGNMHMAPHLIASTWRRDHLLLTQHFACAKSGKDCFVHCTFGKRPALVTLQLNFPARCWFGHRSSRNETFFPGTWFPFGHHFNASRRLLRVGYLAMGKPEVILALNPAKELRFQGQYWKVLGPLALCVESAAY